MSMVRLYTRVLKLLGREARLGWILAGANLLLAARNSPSRCCSAASSTCSRANPPADRGVDLALAAAGGVGGVRPLHHRLRRHRGAARRPARASPAPGRADGLFRAHPATAADLSHRHPFRPADEGDAAAAPTRCGGCGSAFFREHFAAIVSLVVLLPLSLLHQLAAGGAAVDALCVVFTVLTTLVVRKTYAHAERGRGALQRPVRARLRRARQCRAGAELRAHRRRGAGPAHRRRQAARRCRCRCCRGGRWSTVHDARLDHHHGAGDLHRRHLRCISRASPRSARS